MAEVAFVNREGTLVAFLGGEIDHHAADLLRRQIDEKTLQEMPELLLLDFSGVSFMDSSGIGLILGRAKRAQQLGSRLQIINAPKSVDKILALAGIAGGEGEQ